MLSPSLLAPFASSSRCLPFLSFFFPSAPPSKRLSHHLFNATSNRLGQQDHFHRPDPVFIAVHHPSLRFSTHRLVAPCFTPRPLVVVSHPSRRIAKTIHSLHTAHSFTATPHLQTSSAPAPTSTRRLTSTSTSTSTMFASLLTAAPLLASILLLASPASVSAHGDFLSLTGSASGSKVVGQGLGTEGVSTKGHSTFYHAPRYLQSRPQDAICGANRRNGGTTFYGIDWKSSLAGQIKNGLPVVGSDGLITANFFQVNRVSLRGRAHARCSERSEYGHGEAEGNRDRGDGSGRGRSQYTERSEWAESRLICRGDRSDGRRGRQDDPAVELGEKTRRVHKAARR